MLNLLLRHQIYRDFCFPSIYPYYFLKITIFIPMFRILIELSQVNRQTRFSQLATRRFVSAPCASPLHAPPHPVCGRPRSSAGLRVFSDCSAFRTRICPAICKEVKTGPLWMPDFIRSRSQRPIKKPWTSLPVQGFVWFRSSLHCLPTARAVQPNSLFVHGV